MILPGGPRFGVSAGAVTGPVAVSVVAGALEMASAIATVTATVNQRVDVVPGVIEAAGAIATVEATADQLVNVVPGGIEIAGAVASVSNVSLSISFVDSATINDSVTINMPAGIQAGDLAILADWSLNTSGLPIGVVPSLWTQIGTSLTMGTQYCRVLSYKVLDGTETTITGMNFSLASRKLMVVFRKTAGIWGSPQDVAEESTAGNPSAQTVNVGAAPLVVVGSYISTNAVSPRTMTPTKTSEVGVSDGPNYFAWAIYNSSPADTTVDMDDEGSGNILSSFYIAIS